jgi:hypothetical protein
MHIELTVMQFLKVHNASIVNDNISSTADGLYCVLLVPLYSKKGPQIRVTLHFISMNDL